MENNYDRKGNILTPTRVVSNLAKLGKSLQPFGMKSHDYHILLQYIFSISIKGTLSKEIKEGVYHLAMLFRWLRFHFGKP